MNTQPSIGCDDEDNCKPSYRGSGDEEDKNNGSEENGDTTITPPASNSTNSNVRGLRPTIEKVNLKQALSIAQSFAKLY